MAINLLEELDIPRPPYRMARPSVRLAMAENEKKPEFSTMADAFKVAGIEKPSDAEIKRSLEKPVTPEQIDQSVDSKADEAKKSIDDAPSPDAPAAKEKIDAVKREFYSNIVEGKEEQPTPLDVSVLSETARQNYEKAKAADKSVATTEQFIRDQMAFRAEQARKATDEVEKGKQQAPEPVETGYEAELARLKAKQAELRAAGQLEEAAKYDAGIAKYEQWKREQATPPSVEVPVAAKEKGPDFSTAHSFDELREMLIAAGEVVGSMGTRYDANRLIGDITDIRDVLHKEGGKLSAVQTMLSFITATGGLREKVRTLLEQEAREKDFDIELPKSTPEPAAPEAAEPEGREPTEPQPPVPEPTPERPQVEPERPKEYASGVIRSATEWVLEKSVKNAWFSTLWPRLKSVYHRQFAERRAWHQEKAQGSLERARQYQREAIANANDSSWPLKKFYAWRERRWGRAVAKREALVEKYDRYRTRRMRRHNELQGQVFGRYERELAPYRGKVEALRRERKAVITVIETLSDTHANALKLLAAAEAKRSGLFGRRGKAAADRIRRDASEIEQRILKARKNLDKVDAPLAKANAKIAIYEGRQNRVAENMKFSEMEGIKPVQRTRPGKLPERISSFSPTSESAPASPEAADRASEEWGVGEFVKAWNDNGLVRIADPSDFEKFVATQRAKAKETGAVKLGRMLQIVDEYLKSIGSSRGFAKDSRFFMKNVTKKAA